MTKQAKEAIIKAWVEVINFDEIFEDMIAAIKNNCSVDDLFTKKEIREWFEEQGEA